MADVVVEGGDEASYFATMVATTLRQNVEKSRGKQRDFAAMDGDVVIEVTDLELTLTLSFGGNRCVVRDGGSDAAKLTLRTDSETFNGLSLVRIGPLGLPIYIDEAGRNVLKAMATGRLRIGGMQHVQTLNRVTRLFSVV